MDIIDSHKTRRISLISIFKATAKLLRAIFAVRVFKLAVFGLLLALVFAQTLPVESKRPLEVSFGTAQTVNVFPSEVKTNDWSGLDNVLVQDLSGESIYQDFSAKTSAYVPKPELKLPPANGGSTTVETSIEAVSTGSTSVTQTESVSGDSAISSDPVVDESLLVEDVVIPVLEEDGSRVSESPSEDRLVVPESAPEESVETTATPEVDPVSFNNENQPLFGVYLSGQTLFPLAQLSITTGTESGVENNVVAGESVTEPDTENVTEAGVSPVSEVVVDGPISLPEIDTLVEDISEETLITEEVNIADISTSSPNVSLSGGDVAISPELEEIVVTPDLTTSTETISVAENVAEVATTSTSTSNTTLIAGAEVHEITLSNFGALFLEPGQIVNGMQLRLSLAGKLKKPQTENVPYVEVLFGNDEVLSSVGVILLEDEVSNALNGGYYLFALPEFENMEKLAESQVILRYHGDRSDLEGMFLDAVWLELDTRIITEEDFKERGRAGAVAELKESKLHTIVSDKVNFRRDEVPVFNLRYNSQRNFVVRGLRNLVGNDLVSVEEVNITHNSMGLLGIVPDLTVTKDGLLTIEIPKEDLKNMRPGRYQVELVVREGGKEFVDTFDFEWGILTINPHKSEYQVGEVATVSMGVLTPNGHTVCEANLDLYVTNPDGGVSRHEVIPSGKCDGNNVIDVPDYTATVPVTTSGVYQLYLERLDDEGKVLGFTNDTFNATPLQKISIERNGPTRIFPPASYPMVLTVSTTESFTGTVTEYVPREFEVFDTEASVTEEGEWKKLEWNISVLGDGVKKVSYRFDAPDISPYLFNLGPARLDKKKKVSIVASSSVLETTQNNNVFIEHRRWQIASDAVGKMLLFWDDGASVPSGWTCVSCTGGDPFFQRFIMGSSTYNGTGGSANHTHTANGSVLASSAATTESVNGTTISLTTHTHTYTPTISTESNLPAYRQLRVIRYDTAAGEPPTIPAGAIAIFDVASSSLPTNWNRYVAHDGRYVYGENTPGTTGGSNTHSHTVNGNTGTAAGGTSGNRGADAADGAAAGHTHSVSTSTPTIDSQPPYITVLLAKASADTSPTNGIIAMWDQDVDNGWIGVSGDGEAFSERFLVASTSYGTTGGAVSHTYSDMTGIITSAPSAIVTTARAGSLGSDSIHTHSVSVTNFSTESQLPPYVTVVYGKRQGTDPVYNQFSSRWYVNENNQTPSDPWPSGGVNLLEREAITALTTPVKSGDVVRLRINVGVTNATSTAGADFKLQYAPSLSCGSVIDWFDVGDSASTTIWRGYNNTGVADEVTLSSTLLGSSTVAETYEEDGLASTTPNDIYVDDYGEWDFVLEQNGASAGTNYCFRMVERDDTALLTYSHYPQLFTNEAPNAPTLSDPFDNEKVASTSPWFYFVTTDPEGEKLDYQIQVDNNYDFLSATLDRNTVSHSSEFENQVLISDKTPFRNGELIKFTPSSSLTNGTTYYWRVRAQDPEGSGEWGEWSTIQSFTVDTSLTASAWFQTEDEQFDTNSLVGVETGTNQIALISGSTTGTMISGPIDFTDGGTGTAWGSLVFSDTETTGDIKYSVQYLDETETWTLIPDSSLSGNSTGFDTSPVSLLNLDTDIYTIIRLVATFTDVSGSPSLQDWGVNWGYRVETPLITKLFANEQVGTTTPTFEFSTSDPQSDSLTYQVQWSLTPDFAASTTRTSDNDAGFVNIDTGADLDPFNSGETIQFTIQSADVLTGTTTYWWRVRAKDTTGDDAYSFWTEPQSFTVIPGTEVSTWLQTAMEQFNSNTLSGTIGIATDAVAVATTASEAMIVYGEGTETAPRYRLWNGTSLSAEGTLHDVEAPLRSVVVRAGVNREEYVVATVGTDADVNAQVFATGEWGNLQEMTVSMGSINARGFDVAYESLSGDAMVAYCDGDADPSYYIWDGLTWTLGTSTINLTSTNNCEWIQLASDPTSDEIIIMSRDSTGGTYEAQVWDGNTWGNSTTFGNVTESAHEGMAVMYEESGNQAVALSSDGNVARFRWKSWNGTTWSGASTQGIGDDLEWAKLVRDVGSDEMMLCYQDEDSDIGYVHWTGSGWTGQGELISNGTANAKNDPAFACVFEDSAGRDNYVLQALSTTTQSAYSFWNNSTWSTVAPTNSITDSATLQLIRTGSANILATYFNDSSDALRFTTWDGSSWSSTQTIETDASVDTSPFDHPYFMAPRNSGSEGTTVVSPALHFSDGTGPYWKTFSWTDSQPGTSQILYHLQYQTATGSWAFIPDSDLPDNVTGTTTGPFDLSNLNTNTYSTIRPYAELSCDGSWNCPEIQDWKIEWAGGINISGTAQGYDQSTNVTSGTVAVAVNGVLQTGKTGSISAGSWSIGNVTAFAGDIITVFVSGAGDTNEAVAVARYDGMGDMTGMILFERHLTLGSDDATTTPFTNAEIGLYDFTNSEDVFVNVIGTTLDICAEVICADAELYIKADTYYSPTGKFITHDFENNGTLTAGAYTHEVSGSWDNNATTTMTGSTIIMSATSTTETIDSTGAISASFANLTFGTTTGSATWTLGSTLDVNGNLSVTRGTLARSITSITVAGNLTTGPNGYWTGLGTTTFDGSVSAGWDDQNAVKQNVGRVVVDGSSKTVVLAGDVLAQSVLIGVNDTLDASALNYDLTLYGSWENQNNFLARAGAVLFVATTSGQTITTAGDAFYDLTFNGANGTWSFTESTVLVGNDFTIATGTVTLPTATTTIAGSFDATGGAFAHNNGTLYFTSNNSESITFAGGSFSNTAYNLTFNGGGSWTLADVNATTSSDLLIQQGAVTLPIGVLAVGGSFSNTAGAFVGGTGTVSFYSVDSENISTNASSFGNLSFNGTGDWLFTDIDVDINGDFSVNQGTITMSSGTMSIGGSYLNSALVIFGTGAVVFDSTDVGETIDAGSSSFYDISFDSPTGGWTLVAPATTTHDFVLASSSDFTVASGQVLAVGNSFTNQVGGASTTWTGSTLYLYGGDYTINEKTTTGDLYETVQIDSGARVAVWNSSASSYLIGGSLYSQDHAGVDGDLYIFGNYVNNAGAEHWDYATDFDGTSLAGSERSVDVRLASGATVSLNNALLSVVGGVSASTTVANQGSGTYTVTVNGGTTTARYYDFADLGATGVSLLASTTVTSLRDGLFTVAGAGGTALMVSSTTIDKNPAKQIFNVTFATTTAISANNVTQTDGTPVSYWWFRNGTGNLYGEDYDNDDGDPGSVRFDDSSLLITVAGTVYSDAGITPMVGGICDGSTNVVRVVVDGGTAYNGSCSNVDGSYSIPNVNIVGDPTLTVYLDNASTSEKGSVITRTPTSDVTDMDIYVNRVIVRNEDVDALSIANLAVYDSSDDGDLQFTAATSTGGDTLTVLAGNELYVFATSTFTPDGVVTLSANALSNGYDGTLYMATSSIFNAYGTSTLTIGGRLVVGAGATFDAASTTVRMNATTTGKSISSDSEITFFNLNFDGIGGGWNLDADIRIGGDMFITTGTTTGNKDIYVTQGSITGNGKLSLGGGTTTLASTNAFGGQTAWTFYNLALGDTFQVGTTTPLSPATTTVSGKLTINSAHYLDAGGSLWDLSGAGTVFIEDGTFLEGISTVRYSGAGANILSTQYYNLDVNAGVGPATYVAPALGLIVENLLSIGGDGNTTFDVDTTDGLVDVNGDVLVRSNGTLDASGSGTFTIAGSYDNNGTLVGNGGLITFDGAGTIDIASGDSSFSNLTIDATGDVTISESATSTANFILTNANSFTLASDQVLATGGSFFSTLGGLSTTWSSTTLKLYGGANFSLNASTTSDVYDVLVVEGNTQVRMWGSEAGAYTVSAGASLYSQDHAGVDGDLYIWGDYSRSTGADYWSYATDFDGTPLGSGRKVDVYLASDATISVGGTLAVYGVSTASTTVQNQGSGSYSLNIGGSASSSWRYYEIRDIDANGLVFTGTPTIGTLSYGDLEVSQNGGTAMTVGGTVITNNPAKNFTQNRFALNGVAGGFNVTATGTSVSSWRFANHYGDIDGESFDVDPDGDPGYVSWDDSAALITISGNVYSDEIGTVSGICDGSTGNILLRVAGITTATTSCSVATGAYSIPNISYGASDSLVVYIDGEAVKGASVTKEPVSNINGLNIYENRVVVRHESINPIDIADMAVWDSSDDADIPFTAVDAGTDTLTLPANYKLLVWTGKEFAPNGNVTISGGGAGASYDGTLELLDNAQFTGQGTESLSIGGSLLSGAGAVFTASNGTTTFTTTGAGRTIDVNENSFQHVSFTGSGSWDLTDPTFTANGNVTITNGTLTLPTGTSTFSGSLLNTGGSFDANGGIDVFSGTGNRVLNPGNSALGTVYFTAGTYVFTGTNATTTGSLIVENSALTLPSGILKVGGDFRNVSGTLTHNTAEIILTATTSATLLASSSDLYSVRVSGGGNYLMEDNSLALLGDLVVENGDLTLASGTLSIGGSFDASGGTFDNATGTILFNSTDGGEVINAGVSPFYRVQISAPTGGYSIVSDATTTDDFALVSASSFSLQAGASLVVGDVFTNSVGGGATTWTNSLLYLNGANAYTINSKSAGGDVYGELRIGSDSDIRMWNSSSATTTVDTSASLYSQDHGATDGALNIYGDFHISTSTEYWSYTTDFDGTDLSGGERVATVSHGAGATTTVDGGVLRIVGASGNETTITNQGSGTYAMNVSAGNFLAQYYKYRNLNANGLVLSGTPVISSLSYGDYELAVDNGTLISLSSTTLNANASMVITGNRFATTSAITGKNVTLSGVTSNAWTFVSHTGNLDGEDFDVDGGDACGSVRWNDSSCLLVQQTNYRWRNDDGGLGVPNTEWYSGSWSARRYVRVNNDDAVDYTDAAVQMFVNYDSDMQADFDDLRFTDADGVTELSYWVGSTTNSAVAEVWVKIPSLLAESVADIYMYYNNPSATSSASSTATFISADDFEDGNFTEYSGQTSLFTVGTNFNYDGTYGLDNAGSELSRANTGGIYRLDQTVSQGETFRYWQYIDTSATTDETCTKFAVQSGAGVPNNNYGVCVELPGTDHVSLVKNVVDNEASASTIIASSTVSLSTGWYEIEVEWGTDDSFVVTMKNGAGSTVATFSGSDSSYTSGGYGFTFWYNSGGWDSVSSRPLLVTEPTVEIGSEQVAGGASWKATQNSTGIYDVNDIARLRLSVENTGLPITNQQYRLEYAPLGSAPSCEAVNTSGYQAVPVQASCGTSPICMQASSNVTNGAVTAELLTDVNGTFVAGEARENPSNITGNLDIDQGEYTELEYVITPTVNVVDQNLCFRVTNNGTELDTYLRVAKMVLKFDPVFGAMTLNDGQPISLLPGTTTMIYATGTVTDLNGYTDLVLASSTMYRSGVTGGAGCTANNNDCYISTLSSQCSFTDCVGNSCVLSCYAGVYFHADPTDLGSVYEGQEWLAFLEVEDTAGGYDFATTPGVELNTLRAIDVNGAIDYGSLSVNADTGSYNASTSLLNEGNVEINVEVQGTDLTDGVSSIIPANEQKFATSTFTYSSCGASCALLSSTTPVALDVDLTKPTVDSPPIEDNVFWGIYIPIGINSAPHQGVNVFTPISP